MFRFIRDAISSAKLANHFNNIKSLSGRGHAALGAPPEKCIFTPIENRREKAKSRRTIWDIFAKANNASESRNRKSEGKGNNH